MVKFRSRRSHDLAGPGLGLAPLSIDWVTITLRALGELLDQGRAERHRKQREVVVASVESRLEQRDDEEELKLGAARVR